jgi:hypothetical protein
VHASPANLVSSGQGYLKRDRRLSLTDSGVFIEGRETQATVLRAGSLALGEVGWGKGMPPNQPPGKGPPFFTISNNTEI